jgi:SnoaL-like domain
MSSITSKDSQSTEDRLRRIEDFLEISNLIASHTPIADSLAFESMAQMFAPDGVYEFGQMGPIAVDKRDSTFEAAIREAAAMGLAHLNTPPYVKLGKNTALAFSYVAATVCDPTADTITVPAHGAGAGHRLYIIAANRWEMIRTVDGSWKVRRRKLVPCDGSNAPRELQREVLDAVLVD